MAVVFEYGKASKCVPLALTRAFKRVKIYSKATLKLVITDNTICVATTTEVRSPYFPWHRSFW